jgi:uncharacterized protein (TIGR03083 family)
MEVKALIDSLERDGQLLAAAAASSGANAAIPTCPGWKERDLVLHCGGVHRWATAFVAGAVANPGDVSFESLIEPAPDDDHFVDWFREGHAALVGALRAAPADLECWTFLPAPSPRAFWARRQAHETAIHRVDAERAAGRTVAQLSAFTPAFAADGVDELLTCFVPRRSTKLRSEDLATLGVRCSDDAGAWVLSIGPDGVTTVAGDGAGAADCTLQGAAGDLYKALWNRGGDERLQIEGDRSVLTMFGDAVQVRWS